MLQRNGLPSPCHDQAFVCHLRIWFKGRENVNGDEAPEHHLEHCRLIIRVPS
jgi:hypothetical protein